MSKFPLVGCADCNHGMLHHNPDKRMKSGYGKCICGCKKYISPIKDAVAGDFFNITSVVSIT